MSTLVFVGCSDSTQPAQIYGFILKMCNAEKTAFDIYCKENPQVAEDGL